MSALRLESVPADCWDWLTPADVVQHALAAYYAACREVQSSEGPWFDAESRTPWGHGRTSATR